MFGSLAMPNYRRYFVGQVVSLSGTWMQTVAEAWLVLRLTGSGLALGLTSALQFAPILLGGAYGGLLADRLPKRRLLMATQLAMAVPALALWALTASGHVRLWMIFGLVFARGMVNAVDSPARQSFVVEMVGRDRLVNAVSLNAALVHTARIVGPAVAAVIIATTDVSTCFLLNAASFGVLLVALHRMDPTALRQAPITARGPGQLREVLRVVRRTPALRTPLLLMAVVGTLSFNFSVVLPLLARFTFAGNAATFGLLFSAMGVGAVAGALVNGTRAHVSERMVAAAALAFGAALVVAAAAPTLPLAVLALTLVGATSVTFAARINASLQVAAPAELRGRVMGLYLIVFLGSTPIGGPLVGLLSEALGPRAGLAVGAGAALVAGAVALCAARPAVALARAPAA